MKRAVVVVLGDIGRSPRIKNHALELANNGYQVDFVGYIESELPKLVSSHESITVHELKRFGPFPLKFIFLAFSLLFLLLFRIKRASFILVQNPPCIPTFAVVKLACWLKGMKMIIDWHNLGYTIMRIKFKRLKWLIKACKEYELFVGAQADFHFCVTKGLKKFLISKGIKQEIIKIVYDLPTVQSSNQESSILESLGLKNSFVMMTSTSWTDDEDFELLLDALRLLDNSRALRTKLALVITGKGPNKAAFEEKLSLQPFRNVIVKLAWLSSSHYFSLISECNVGVCLHFSSSGLDFPMKIIDMFGSGLPVIAFDFPCLHELVQVGKNGLVFKTANELASCIERCIENDTVLMEMRNNLQNSKKVTWASFYKREVLPVL